jgi:MraZ protein
MVTRKTQVGWMALGSALCLFSLVLAWKVRDGNRARAQAPASRSSVATANGPAAATLKRTLIAQATELKPLLTPGSAEPTPPVVKTSEPPLLEIPSLPSDALPRETNEPPLPTLPAVKPMLPPVLTPVRFEEPAPPLPPPSLPTPPAPPAAPPAIEKVKEPILPAPMPPMVKDLPKPMPPVVQELPPPAPTTSTPLPPLSEPTPTPPPVAPIVSKPVPAARANAVVETSESTVNSVTPLYRVRHDRETLRDIARRTLGTPDRWNEVSRLNPALHTERGLTPGTLVKLPADAALLPEEMEVVKPLPLVRQKTTPMKSEPMPLTGTYVGQLGDNRHLTLPRAMREQLGDATVMVSPGSDVCLWLTTPEHLERLNKRLEAMRVRESDLRVFRRLYFAQAERVTVNGEGQVVLPDRLCQFAGLEREVILVGVDDHIEIWDAAQWKRYAQEKSAAARNDGE